MNEKMTLTICPCCEGVAIGNGRNNVVCLECGFAFIAHDEAKKPPTFTEQVDEVIKILNDVAEAMRKAGFIV